MVGVPWGRPFVILNMMLYATRNSTRWQSEVKQNSWSCLSMFRNTYRVIASFCKRKHIPKDFWGRKIENVQATRGRNDEKIRKTSPRGEEQRTQGLRAGIFEEDETCGLLPTTAHFHDENTPRIHFPRLGGKNSICVSEYVYETPTVFTASRSKRQ